MKKVVMILSVTLITLTTIEEASEHEQLTQPDEGKEFKLYLAVGLNKVPGESDGADEVPRIPTRLKKYGSGRVKSMEFTDGVPLTPSKSLEDLLQQFRKEYQDNKSK